MSTTKRLVSAFFTVTPGMFLSLLFVSSNWLDRDYWWGTYTAVLLVLSMTSLVFGFALPEVFQRLRMNHPWQWIILQGLLAWILSLAVLWLLNLTPLCIGQNNGDGNNDLGLCMFMTVMAAVVYTPIYLGLLTASAAIGHGVLALMSPKATT